MIDEWLKVAYRQELSTRGQRELENILSQFPLTDLRKLASGLPVDDLLKQAYLDACPSTGSDCETFLDRFKGTPLFDQAMALEQEELQCDILQQQRNEERRMEGDIWEMRDKIRLKKRLLELEKAKMDAGQAGAPETPAQGAGAPGGVPAEGVQDSSQGLQGGVAKTGSAVVPDEAKQKFAFADSLGRELAHADFQKAAQVHTLRSTGEVAGAIMAKTAFDWGGLAKTVSGIALKHPAAMGAALGAGVGAHEGGPGHRLSGALGGAALGGTAGGIGRRMIAGQGFTDAAKGFGGSVLSKLRGMMPGAGTAAPAPKQLMP